MTIEQHYKTKELAALLAVHPDTILRLTARGELKSKIVAGEHRYAESDVQAYLEKTQPKATRLNAAVVPIAAARDDRSSRARRSG